MKKKLITISAVLVVLALVLTLTPSCGKPQSSRGTLSRSFAAGPDKRRKGKG